MRPAPRCARRIAIVNDSIPTRLFEQARLRPDRPAYYRRDSGAWRATSWSTYAGQVRQAAAALAGLGLAAEQGLCLLSYNRPEWAIAHVAAMALGAIPTGIYTTAAAPEAEYILGHTAARVLVVESAARYAKIARVRDRLPELETVILMEGEARGEGVITWAELMARGEDREAQARIEEGAAGLDPEATATLIYTSGTTGQPKGVMLSHRNLTWVAAAIRDMLGLTEEDSGLSYLPLSHIAEQSFTISVPATVGASVYYAESLEKVRDNLRSVQPTLFFGVPRVWEKFHAAARARFEELAGLKRFLIDWAGGVAARVHAASFKGEAPGLALRLQYGLARRLVFRKLKRAIGLGRCRYHVSGAAPLSAEVLRFFVRLDIPIHEVYGQSEDAGPTSFNRPGCTRLGTVGPPFPGVDVRIAEDGEILVRGPNVFKGYFKDPDATAEALDDEGWLRSGDLGALDDDGFLTITGRKKDIVITAGGKNIAPRPIEEALVGDPLVAHAVVIGDQRPYLTALIALEPEAARAYAQKAGVSPQELDGEPELRARIQKRVDAANSQRAPAAQIKRFRVLPRAFTIEDGDLTPTMKLKRAAIAERFAEEVERLYQ